MRIIRVLTLVSLAVPATLATQQPAPQSMDNPTTASFRAFGARYGGFLVQAFDSIPAAKYSYKPTPVQQSIGYIAQHLEDANNQICGALGTGKPKLTAKDSLADTVKAAWPKDTLVARLKASLEFCDAVIARLDDSKLGEMITVGPPGRQRQIPRARYLIVYVTDLAEHYAQLASYMRINGLIPPTALPRPSR